MSPVAYARQASSASSVARGAGRLAAFVTGWWVVLAVVARVGPA